MKIPLTACAALLIAAGPPAAAPDRDLYVAPDKQLDSRIDPGKVTEYDPPPLPEQVVLPVPPEFRIAPDAKGVGLPPRDYLGARRAVIRGLEYLKSRQGPTGGWLTDMQAAPTDRPGEPSPIAVAVTALAIKAFAQADPGILGDANFALALRFVEASRHDDGSFGGGGLANYVTSSVVMALSTIGHDDFGDEIDGGVAWLQVNQWDQSEGVSARQDWFGGAGYGNHGRPDVSNTQMMLDALYEAGMSPDEPAVQRALSFISRAQNLQATNKAPWAGNDGGFVYTPANGGESMASESAGEGRHGELIPQGRPPSLRSYGSMTYAGFKSLLYAGLSPDDVRVRAAFDWIRRNWTFDENPGLGLQGLYYYYHALARCLRAAQQNEIEDADGNARNWRQELVGALVARQRDDGSWVNQADRWLEGEPVMATIHAVLALEEALKPVLRMAPAPAPAGAGAAATDPLRFSLTYDESVTGSFTGRVYVLLTPPRDREPRYGPDWVRPGQLFSLDVEDWRPSAPLAVSDGALGFPGAVDEVPPGRWAIQAVMRRNPDSPFVGLGEGNAFSAVVVRDLDGARGGEVALAIDRVDSQRPFSESESIRLVEIESDLLSAFYGRPIVQRAAVILPDGYDESGSRRYPALYFIGGFGSDHRLGPRIARWFGRTDGADNVVLVVPDPLCGTGHHAFADSANNGPRGRAFVEELIPAIERRFRVVAAPRGRYLTGVSSGGWSSLWLQVTHPDFFGGVWSISPDPVDFRAFQLTNIYEPGANLFIDADGRRVPIMRRGDEIVLWYDSFARMEDVVGRGGQLASFDAVFSPRRPDGTPAPLFDRRTGDVDPRVAEAWEDYDVKLVLERNWDELGPKLAGRIRIWVGADDNFFLEGAVVLLKEWLDSVGADANVEILPGRDHSNVLNSGYRQRLLAELLTDFGGQ